MGWFETVENPKLKSQKRVESNTPSGLWTKCSNCNEILQSTKLSEAKQVCPYCDFHFRLSARERLNLLIDENSFEEFPDSLNSNNPLTFEDKKSYELRLNEAKKKTGNLDGTIYGKGKINSKETTIAIMNFSFMGGSMGVVAGEKISRVMDCSLQKKIPCVVVSSSGGARMQEGIVSLMQMAKTSAIRSKLRKAGIPFISILTDPTTGGVAASFAMLGDVNIAEPKALIGFAGPRVIEQSIRQTLPEGFQRSEFMLEHGFVDQIVHRKELKNTISFFLNMFS